MAEIVVETERLALRRWVPGDVDAWLAHLNTPEVTAHLGGVRSPGEIAKKFGRMARAWDEEGFSFLAVVLRPCGTFLGTCGLARIEADCAPDALRGAIQIGWQLRADHWGQGYALEAARAVIDMAFARHGAEMLYSQTSLGNRASWGLMEKLGLRRRADLDYDDPKYPPEDNPTIVYALGREAWRALSGEAAG